MHLQRVHASPTVGGKNKWVGPVEGTLGTPPAAREWKFFPFRASVSSSDPCLTSITRPSLSCCLLANQKLVPGALEFVIMIAALILGGLALSTPITLASPGESFGEVEFEVNDSTLIVDSQSDCDHLLLLGTADLGWVIQMRLQAGTSLEWPLDQEMREVALIRIILMTANGPADSGALALAQIFSAPEHSVHLIDEAGFAIALGASGSDYETLTPLPGSVTDWTLQQTSGATDGGSGTTSFSSHVPVITPDKAKAKRTGNKPPAVKKPSPPV